MHRPRDDDAGGEAPRRRAERHRAPLPDAHHVGRTWCSSAGCRGYPRAGGTGSTTSASGKVKRKDGLILLMDDRHLPHNMWTFNRGLPVKFQGPRMNGSGNDVAIESLEIAHEGLWQLSILKLGASAIGARSVMSRRWTSTSMSCTQRSRRRGRRRVADARRAGAHRAAVLGALADEERDRRVAARLDIDLAVDQRPARCTRRGRSDGRTYKRPTFKVFKSAVTRCRSTSQFNPT